MNNFFEAVNLCAWAMILECKGCTNLEISVAYSYSKYGFLVMPKVLFDE